MHASPTDSKWLFGPIPLNIKTCADPMAPNDSIMSLRASITCALGSVEIFTKTPLARNLPDVDGDINTLTTCTPVDTTRFGL